jgi:hypothetical protein
LQRATFRRSRLKALDRLTAIGDPGQANQVYDDDARKNLVDRINRIASNLGADEAAPRRCSST